MGRHGGTPRDPRAALLVFALAASVGLLTSTPSLAGAKGSGGPTPVLLRALPRPPVSGAEYGLFAQNVALSGSTAVVVAIHTDVPTNPCCYEEDQGAVLVYERKGARWSSTPIATLDAPQPIGQFGTSVAISGSTIVVSDPLTNNNSGEVYLYVKQSHEWPLTPTVTLVDPLGATDDGFGNAVAISGDTIVIGAPGSAPVSSGVTYVYTKRSNGWPTTPTLTLPDPTGSPTNPSNDGFGNSVAVSGSTMMIAANGQGGNLGPVVYQYTDGSTGWSSIPNLILTRPSPADYCFSNPTLSGRTALFIGCYGTSHLVVYVYVEGRSGWVNGPASTIEDPDPSRNDRFGEFLAISGNTLIITASNIGQRTMAGTAYVYKKGNAGYWPVIPTATIPDPQATNGDQFGTSVAVSGTTALIGARAADPDFLGSGAAYLYHVS